MTTNEFKKQDDLPNNAILLSIFKTIEKQFQDKGFLPKLSNNVEPLWVFAEKEKDNYLWRKGSSISSASNLEFWINIRKLCKKRLKQIELSQEGFEVLHSGRSSEALKEPSLLKQEMEYLKALIQTSSKIEKHASALSHAGVILENEISNKENKNITFILLPC